MRSEIGYTMNKKKKKKIKGMSHAFARLKENGPIEIL